MEFLYLAIAVIVGYFLGNINFARIFSWRFAKKDITTVGSKNPGAMNMLRTRGFGEAILTLAFEALKVGGPALACYFLFEHYFVGFGDLAFFSSAFAGILGHCFPVVYGFKGGKGVACTFGMFLFNPHFWWMSLAIFAICFLLFFFVEYGFIISLIFILTLSIYATCFFVLTLTMWYIPLVVILWLNFILVVYLHRSNFKRFFAGTENKLNFKEKIFGTKNKQKVENAVEENVPNETEIHKVSVNMEKESKDSSDVKVSKPKVKSPQKAETMPHKKTDSTTNKKVKSKATTHKETKQKKSTKEGKKNDEGAIS